MADSQATSATAFTSELPYTMSSEDSTPQVQANDGEKVPMALISIAQRNSLIEYMAKQPYQEVANGIEFLRNAPIVEVNLIATDPVDDEREA